MHLNDDQIQRLLHGELDASQREAFSRHVAECRRCALTLDEARRGEKEIFDLLRHVDHAPPAVDVEMLAPSRRRAPAVWGRRVAVLLIAAVLGSVAYALPGSPVPELLDRVAEWVTGRTPTRQAEERPAAREPATSGISVAPKGRFAIHFTSEQSEGAAIVSLTESPNVVVRVLGGAAAFTTETGRLVIENRGSSADYEIEVPREAPWVEIFVGSRRSMLKDEDRITSDAPVDPRGRFVLRLAGPGPAGD